VPPYVPSEPRYPQTSRGGDGGHGGVLLGLGRPLGGLAKHFPLVQRLQLPRLDKELSVDPDVRDLRAPRAQYRGTSLMRNSAPL